MRPFNGAALPDFTKETLNTLPLAQSETIPSSWYTDPGFHALDRHAVFEQTWQYVGPATQVADPGACVPVTVGAHPVVVLRDAQWTLRGFYNVCRHRAGPLITAPCTVQMLQCKYHGWTYKTDGTLRGVPRFDRTELFDRKDYGLIPVHVDTWEGLLFVNLAAQPPPLAEVLSGIPERIAPMVLSALTFHQQVVYEVACNWKVYVDNFLEGYHLPFVHPELCTVLDVQAYATETFGLYSLQHSPLRGADTLYGKPEGAAYYYFVFPNFMLNILPGRLQTNRVEPVSERACRVVFDYYYQDPALMAQVAAADLAYSEQVQQEDITICEQVQRGLDSRGYDRGRFSVECEAGVHHFQSCLKAAYRQAVRPDTL